VVKVFLVDDDEVVRRGLIDLLSADAELDVVGEAGSVAQALERGSPRSSPMSRSSTCDCQTATASNCAENSCLGCRTCAA
jgi:hypothetical protein